MTCSCGSKRIAKVVAKCSDCCFVTMGNREHDSYVPKDMNIGGGDYIQIQYCLDCGKLQGDFPLPETKIEESVEEDNDDHECRYSKSMYQSSPRKCVDCGKEES